ncbi:MULTISPECIES: hypothetical protein [unclassified Rhodanobacter]|uniref:hypothetical protein n=1 Tax=unclassified Rhodanobacter TaxID=2621553 RepID=UPI00128FE816|nr:MULTISPECIES: hypothetical protein [unclassified Rhodanobacter]
MQTLFVHSAFWRGVSLFAGMLFGKIARNKNSGGVYHGGDLVSWHPGARSRREDELVRSRQIGLP